MIDTKELENILKNNKNRDTLISREAKKALESLTLINECLSKEVDFSIKSVFINDQEYYCTEEITTYLEEHYKSNSLNRYYVESVDILFLGNTSRQSNSTILPTNYLWALQSNPLKEYVQFGFTQFSHELSKCDACGATIRYKQARFVKDDSERVDEHIVSTLGIKPETKKATICLECMTKAKESYNKGLTLFDFSY